MYRHVQSLREAAGLDPEQLIAPKELWFDLKPLKEWLDSRQHLREQELLADQDGD